jgi:hypothetical protein
MRNDQRDRGAVEVNRVMREEAAKRAPQVVYVDSYRIFAGEDGGYTESLEDADGDTIRVRIEDGVHFTPKGAEHLAAAVFALLDARYDIVEQADPEHAKQYQIVRGSGGGGSGGSGGGSSSRTTTPPTTPDGPDETTPTSSATTETTVPPTTAPTPDTTVPPTTSPPTTTPTPPTT